MSKTKRRMVGRINAISKRLLEQWKETGDEEFYKDYDAIETILNGTSPDYLRPFYLPVRRKDFMFKTTLKNTKELEKYGFKLNDKGIYYKFLPLYSSIEASIEIPAGFKVPRYPEVIDVYDYITVMDFEFCQPYDPFYMSYHNEITNFPALQRIFMEYNNKMESMGLFKVTPKAE